jgi:hypothetical protein
VLTSYLVEHFVSECAELTTKGEAGVKAHKAVKDFKRASSHRKAISKGSEYLATYKPFLKLLDKLNGNWVVPSYFNSLELNSNDDSYWMQIEGGNLYSNYEYFDTTMTNAVDLAKA